MPDNVFSKLTLATLCLLGTGLSIVIVGFCLRLSVVLDAHQRIESFGGSVHGYSQAPKWLHEIVGDKVLLPFLDIHEIYLQRKKISMLGNRPVSDIDDNELELMFTPLDLRHLRVVHLGGTSIGDAGLKHFASSPHLKWVHLGETKITDTGLIDFVQGKNFESVLMCSTNISENCLKQIQQDYPKAEFRKDGLLFIYSFENPPFPTLQDRQFFASMRSIE